MCTKYFELFSDIRLNNHNFNTFCKELIICNSNEDVYIQKDMNYFQNTYLLTAFESTNHYKMSKEDYNGIKSLISKIGINSHIISCDFEFNNFIIELFKNYKNNIYKIGCDTLFYKNTNKNYDFLKEFFDIFKPKIVSSSKNLSHYLNLKRLCLPNIDFIDPHVLKKDIHSGNKGTRFYEADRFSTENIIRLNSGDTLKFEYNKSTIKEKFILLKSLLKISKEKNLPTNTISKIIKNLHDEDYIETFNYYYYNLICKHQKLENFKCRKFKGIDEAISYAIDLELVNIRGYLIEFRKDYCICYENIVEIEPSRNIEKNKKIVIQELNKYIDSDNKLDSYNLKDLVNIQVFNNKPILGCNHIVYDSKPVPLNLIINKGQNMYNITGNLLNFRDKKYLEYDRSNFYLDRDIEIELIEKIDTYYSIVVNFDGMYISYDRDFYIPEKVDNFKEGVVKAIKKGYLVSDAGLVRYITTSELLVEDIDLPCWFKSNTEEEFLFLMHFFKNI